MDSLRYLLPFAKFNGARRAVCHLIDLSSWLGVGEFFLQFLFIEIFIKNLL